MGRLAPRISAILLGLWPLMSAPLAVAKQVTFAISAPEARAVEVYGSFDRWSSRHMLMRDSTGLWSITLDTPKGRIEYLFMVDGQRQINPRFPSIDDGFGGRNNVLIVR